MSEFSRLTRAIRTGIDTDTSHGAVVPPLHMSSTFRFAGFAEPGRYDYTRSGNPTRDLLGEALATLEGGAGGVVTATGMAAVNVVLTAFSSPERTVVLPHDCYGGTWRLFNALAARGSVQLLTVDFNDAQAYAEALATMPSLVWVETPSNPLLRLTDIAAATEQAHAAGALVAVDNTFCSPVLQRPLELGADLVVHSTTKYLNGHSDVVGGAVVSATQELHEEVARWANALGLTGSPFDSYQTLRGLRTLPVRIRAHGEAAAAVVEALQAHEAVTQVYYPGLSTHPGHEIATRQQEGFGAMVSFELAGGEQAARRFASASHLFTLAESLGGTESLLCHPATMTHAAMSPEARAVAGIGEGLLRLSVGLEQPADLVADLQAALDAAR